ncbi:EndoU domain-containing protein [Microcoleus sp. A003_D6]|uniref:EndoU domain-containing protein n=1 Tax=Microcoleus sp. A003_D6 TaxID=3055266 RepID=UPI002FD2ADD1
MSNHSLGNIPSGIDVNNLSQINSQQRTHILDSDATGGGHGPGRGISGKSEFPTGWSDEQTINYISEVVKDPNSIWFQQNGTPGAKYTKRGKPVKWQIDGTRNGVNIRVIVEPDGRGLITAFPTNIPLNP